jgi:hypothetical protein
MASLLGQQPKLPADQFSPHHSSSPNPRRVPLDTPTTTNLVRTTHTHAVGYPPCATTTGVSSYRHGNAIHAVRFTTATPLRATRTTYRSPRRSRPHPKARKLLIPQKLCLRCSLFLLHRVQQQQRSQPLLPQSLRRVQRSRAQLLNPLPLHSRFPTQRPRPLQILLQQYNNRRLHRSRLLYLQT